MMTARTSYMSMCGKRLWGSGLQLGALYNMGYLLQTYLKLKSREVSFAHGLLRIC